MAAVEVASDRIFVKLPCRLADGRAIAIGWKRSVLSSSSYLRSDSLYGLK